MKKLLFAVLCDLSLLLCVVLIALWARSYATSDQIAVNSASYPYVGNDAPDEPMYKDRITDRSFTSNRGVFETRIVRSTEEGFLLTENLKDWKDDYPQGTFVEWDRSPASPVTQHLPWANLAATHVQFDHFGFFAGTYSVSGMMAGSVDFVGQVVSVPFWPLIALAAGLPAIRLLAWLRFRRRLQRGWCRTCGYDLRASEDRCPECGSAITSDAEAIV